jgi:hypothetical protein
MQPRACQVADALSDSARADVRQGEQSAIFKRFGNLKRFSDPVVCFPEVSLNPGQLGCQHQGLAARGRDEVRIRQPQEPLGLCPALADVPALMPEEVQRAEEPQSELRLAYLAAAAQRRTDVCRVPR